MERYAPVAADEVFCQKTTIAFVDHVAEIFQALICGKPLLLIPAEASKDPQRLAEAVSAGRVTRLTVVPSLLNALLVRGTCRTCGVCVTWFRAARR